MKYRLLTEEATSCMIDLTFTPNVEYVNEIVIKLPDQLVHIRISPDYHENPFVNVYLTK